MEPANTARGYTEKHLEELKAFFSSVELKANVTLAPGSTLIKPELMLTSHYSAIRLYMGSALCEPFFDRLYTYRDILTAGTSSPGNV